MRLLIHGINYAPELVGIGRYTGEMAVWLASRGHQVTVLTAPPYYPEWRVKPEHRLKWRQEWLEGVEVLRAPLYAPSRVTGKTRLLHELSFGASSLFWWPRLLNRRWDAVLAVCPLLQSGLIPAWLARRQRIPFIFHYQDLQVDAARDLGMLRVPGLFPLLEGLERFILRQAAAVSTLSRGMAARVQGKGVAPERLFLLPNWADLDNIRPGSRENALRKELGLKAEETLALYAGNLGEKQGLETILTAARLTRNQPSLRYVLAGDGAAGPGLRELARSAALDNVTFLPLQSNLRFPLLLAAGDIHLVVQREKAADLVMPSKLTNILAAGRPFIATARPDTELGRVTRESQAGVLTPPEDGAALAQAVLGLAAAPEVRREMGEKARKFAETHLDRETILLRLEDLLLSLTGNKSPEVPEGSGLSLGRAGKRSASRLQ